MNYFDLVNHSVNRALTLASMREFLVKITNLVKLSETHDKSQGSRLPLVLTLLLIYNAQDNWFNSWENDEIISLSNFVH